jgi:hypothetical protein
MNFLHLGDGISENAQLTKFAEFHTHDVRRTPLLGTSVNREKYAISMLAASGGFSYPRCLE